MLQLKLVLDTNVVVSAHLSPEGLERLVLIMALTPPARMFISPKVLVEYREVLHRKRLKIIPAQADRSLRLIQARAELVVPKKAVSIATDPTDNRFLECAEEAKADYFVTGNKRHFPKTWKDTRIVNARELLASIDALVE